MVEEPVVPDSDVSHRLWPKSLVAYDLTLPLPEENLAFDEALLNTVETDPAKACLRIWEPDHYFVVLGRSNRAETEVNLDVCESEGIPILRRASGGGTVLVGPGCLCYTLALPLTDVHRTLGVSGVTLQLMERTAVGIESILDEVNVRGTSDLVWRSRKFSGNAQRWLRRSFVHHGTLLYNFDLEMLARCITQPSRQPEYRQSRGHLEFVANIPCGAEQLRKVLAEAWNAVFSGFPTVQLDQVQQIVQQRYRSPDWNR